MTPARILVAALVALRLTRFVTSDYLGEWTIAGPAKRWAWRHDKPAPGLSSETVLASDPNLPRNVNEAAATPFGHWGWRSKLVKGLDCPFCVGFWLGVLVLLAELVAPRIPVVRHLWRFAAGALALNYVTGHVSARIDG